jgi:hypothetical protein
MSNLSSINTHLLEEWVASKINVEEVNKKLNEMGLNEDAVAEHVKEFKRIRYHKRRFNAFIFMAIGAIIGFISCVLTVTDVLPHMFDIFLYGLTTAAAILVFRGLYLLFEG